ncbi:MAG: DUF5671 domain-containing protein [Candidatus Baltobacteraceae bacterium]
MDKAFDMERTDDDLLVAFIEKARASGIADATTVEILKQRGWSERRIYRAFSTAAERALGIEIPVRGSAQEYARDAYLYLVSFITIALWSYSLGNIFYVMIDYWIPDRAHGWTISTHELPQYLSWPIAMLVVAFPIFMFVNAALQRDLSQRPEGFSTGVRKWLTYIALVGTVATLVFDAVSFLQSFLLGNLTTHFILNSLVLLVVAGGIFSYYLVAVRSTVVAPRRERLYALVATIAVIATLSIGFTAMGSPGNRRKISADARRLTNLREIEHAIHAKAVSEKARKQNFTLPARLSAIEGLTSNQIADPISGRPYEYDRLGDSRYRLCATFSFAHAAQTSVPSINLSQTKSGRIVRVTADAYPDTTPEHRWAHGAGRACFVRSI